MRKYHQILIWGIALSLFLAGCVVVPDIFDTQSTVEDLFIPTTQSATETIPPQQEATEPTGSEPVRGGGMGWEIQGTTRLENGVKYLTYTGGEACIPLHVEGHGIVKEYGIGILLFVDGKPQAYRTTENDEMKYLHSFTKETYTVLESGDIVIDTSLLFTPVSGNQGEYVPCYLVSIMHPDFSPEEWGLQGSTGHKLTSASMKNTVFLKYEEQPPATEPLPVLDRITDLEITTEETTYDDIKGWSDEDMLINTRYDVIINGMSIFDPKYDWEWDITEETEFIYQFALWGCPYLHYELVIFMDNLPVSVSEEDIIQVSVQSGMKTIVTVKLDLKGFDGESPVYCVLVPKNKLEYWGPELLCGTIVSRYTLLFDDPRPIEED